MKSDLLRLINNRLKYRSGLAAFEETVDWFRSASPEKSSHLGDILQRVLIDKALIVEIIKAANSVFYNPAGFPITTISRAITVLGLKTVKKLALATPTLKSFQEKDPLFLQEISLSYLMAYLARGLIKPKRLRPEEIYLIALFRRIGREILLLNARDVYQQLMTKSEEQQRILFSLVAERLLQYWNLPYLFLQGLEGNYSHPTPVTLEKNLYLVEVLAKALIKGEPIQGVNRSLSPKAFSKALENLKKDLEIFPQPVASFLAKVLDQKITFETVPVKPQPSPGFYNESIISGLLRKFLLILEGELKAQGLLFLGNQKISINEDFEEEVKDLTLAAFQDLFSKSEPQEIILKNQKALFIPLEAKGLLIGGLLLIRKRAFSQEERLGLKLVKKTLDLFLGHISGGKLEDTTDRNLCQRTTQDGRHHFQGPYAALQGLVKG